MTDPSAATWTNAFGAWATALILLFTLIVAWINLQEFKTKGQIARTIGLFSDFYTCVYIVVREPGHPDRPITPYIALTDVISRGATVRRDVLIVAHNFLEAIATLHWKHLIDDELYFDTFGIIIRDAYMPLKQGLDHINQPLTSNSRIPRLYDDVGRYLKSRDKPATSKRG